MKSKAYTDQRIQQFDLTSERGETYQISICLPENWGQTDKPHQVVVVTDADILFTAISGAMPVAAFEIPALANIMVVAIGYGELNLGDRATFLERRTNDLTQADDPGLADLIGGMLGKDLVPTGGADNFLAFIADKLLPCLEADWNASPDGRTMFGGSLGGNFGLHAMFKRPELFASHFYFSPVVSIGDNALFALEEEFAKSNRKLAANLHMIMGEIEEAPRYGPTEYFGKLVSVSNFIRFSAQLKGREYEGLNLTTQIIPRIGHFESGLRGVEILLNRFLPQTIAE